MILVLSIIIWIINLISTILTIIMYKKYETIDISVFIMLFISYTFEIFKNIIMRG